MDLDLIALIASTAFESIINHLPSSILGFQLGAHRADVGVVFVEMDVNRSRSMSLGWLSSGIKSNMNSFQRLLFASVSSWMSSQNLW